MTKTDLKNKFYGEEDEKYNEWKIKKIKKSRSKTNRDYGNYDYPFSIWEYKCE